MKRIPVYQPMLNGNEKKYVNDCLDTTWISSKGKYVQLFEQGIAKYLGAKYAVAVSNGTVALHLSLVTLGIGAGDEVIVPTFTYIASVNAIAYTGAQPVFVDSLASTWQIDPNDIRKRITPRTKAIMVVHLYGHPCEMDAIMDIADEYNLLVIEDCAEAFGAKYKGRHVGTFGDVSAYSFFGNKTITCGEGGMLVTNSKRLFDKANHLKSQGVSPQKAYWHDEIGYNYRMTNICAAIGLAQLEQSDVFIAKKRQIASWYQDYLKNTSVTILSENNDVVNSYWMVSLLMPKIEQRDEIRQYLELRGVETRPLFYPAHLMPMYNHLYMKYRVAEDIGLRGINLPSYPGLKENDVKYICVCIKEFLRDEK